LAASNEASKPIELQISVIKRRRGNPLGAQIEDQLRRAIRARTLQPGAQLASTRDLARQLGVSRRVVAGAYAQLAAEGYLIVRQGSRPRVSNAAAVTSVAPAARPRRAPSPRFDFRPSVPDLSAFPRTAWLRSVRRAVTAMHDSELDYGDPRGAEPLRSALAEYLGRVRGVAADPSAIVVCTGYAQGRALASRALAQAGAKRIAIEDPSHPEQRAAMTAAGLELVAIPVDEAGLRVDRLADAAVDAVVLTPAHQFPSGAVLASERRAALLDWLRESDTIAMEDDYDAEYRYDRAAVGTLQGLAPDRIVYAGSASKTLAPALRIGWLVVPDSLRDAVVGEKRLADLGSARMEQHALADFVARGELDRHLRRMRARYRGRRQALVQALAERLPEARIQGIAAGLHAAVQLPDGDEEPAILEQARRRRIALTAMGDYRVNATGPPTLLLGYAQSPEPTIRRGIAELADAVRTARARRPIHG
jgi:GntR family transcriptional regulator / MocR family aminotransferase